MASTLKTSPVIAPDAIKSLLHRLHELSIAQQGDIDKATSHFKDFDDSDKLKAYLDDEMRDKFVALDEDKCQFLYQLARAIGAKNIVEAGTSFGVSTIYLALAVGSNVDGVEGAGKVIATENETSKAKKAQEYWEEAGKLVTDFVEFREGNLLDTLKSHLPTIDLLLLDIWTPFALPTLKLVLPNMRPGAVVIIDNTVSSVVNYQELLTYLRSAGSPFTNVTLPFVGGLEMCVYLPSE